MSQETRVTLLQRLRNRQDEASWADFAGYYLPFIRAVLRQLGAASADLEDLSQEVLLRAWKALPEFTYQEGRCQFRTWLGQLCRYSLLNSIRHDKTKSRQQPEHFTVAESSDPEIEAIAEQEWQTYISQLAWSNIRERFTESVQQSFLLSAEGLTSVEIAKRLKLAESSVRVNKQRLTAALCKEIVRLDNELQR